MTTIEGLDCLLFILVCYLVYLVAGFTVLYLVDKRLTKWVHDAPNIFLFVITWTLWPLVIIAYYVKSRND